MKRLSLLLFVLILSAACSSVIKKDNRHNLELIYNQSQKMANLCGDENKRLSKEQKAWCEKGIELLKSESFAEFSKYSKREVTLADVTTLIWAQQKGISLKEIDDFLELGISVSNPYCEEFFPVYQVFQVLDDSVLAEGCRNSDMESCDYSESYFLFPREKGKLYYEGLYLFPAEGECSVSAGTYTYTLKDNTKNTIPVLMFVSKDIDRMQLNNIKQMRESSSVQN